MWPPAASCHVGPPRTPSLQRDSPAWPSPVPTPPTVATLFPQTLEQLLERQWDQGSSFLMKQAQHFDIASLLSCLHQLRSENLELETRIGGLQARRDQLLAVSARLLGPLGSLAAASPAQVVPQTSAEAAATAAMDAQTGLPSAACSMEKLPAGPMGACFPGNIPCPQESSPFGSGPCQATVDMRSSVQVPTCQPGRLAAHQSNQDSCSSSPPTPRAALSQDHLEAVSRTLAVNVPFGEHRAATAMLASTSQRSSASPEKPVREASHRSSRVTSAPSTGHPKR